MNLLIKVSLDKFHLLQVPKIVALQWDWHIQLSAYIQVRRTKWGMVPVWRADDNKLLGRAGKLVSEQGRCLSEVDYRGTSQSLSNGPTKMSATLWHVPKTLEEAGGTPLPESCRNNRERGMWIPRSVVWWLMQLCGSLSPFQSFICTWPCRPEAPGGTRQCVWPVWVMRAEPGLAGAAETAEDLRGSALGERTVVPSVRLGTGLCGIIMTVIINEQKWILSI